MVVLTMFVQLNLTAKFKLGDHKIDKARREIIPKTVGEGNFPVIS
jgi:hypothetical protein